MMQFTPEQIASMPEMQKELYLRRKKGLMTDNTGLFTRSSNLQSMTVFFLDTIKPLSCEDCDQPATVLIGRYTETGMEGTMEGVRRFCSKHYVERKNK